MTPASLGGLIPAHSAPSERVRSWRYRIVPTCDTLIFMNPFRKLRLGHDYKLSEFCKTVHVMRSAMIRLEHGTYANPLPSVTEWWVYSHGECIKCAHLELTELKLANAYEDFQLNQRQQHLMYFGRTRHLHDIYDLNSDVHPFRQIRGDKGVTQVSRDLCLPLDTLQFFEKRWVRQQSVPKLLCTVLNYIGYSNLEINQFKADYKAWRQVQLSKRGLKYNG